MPATPARAVSTVLEQFEGPWRDETPVFACCRKAVAAAVDTSDLAATSILSATERVAVLRGAVTAELPGHLEAHRCCSGHVADLAFDLPFLIAPAGSDEL